MVKYRRRVDIIADILKIAIEGAKKTKIMYFGNLSYRLLEKYLSEITRAGFLFPNGSNYEVTDKGKAFLEKYTEFSRRYSRLESDLQNMLFEKEALEKMCETSRLYVKSPRRRMK